MLGQMSSRRFILLCAFVAATAAVVSLCFLATVVTILQDSFKFEILERWDPWPAVIVVALACGGGGAAWCCG